jgi:hypothetical protein
MAQTYNLVTISDLLKVPIDRREDCVRDLLYALALADLTFGEMLTLKITEGGT